MSVPKILIVDDSPLNHTLVRAHLASEQYEIHSADSGIDALRLVNQVCPDVILLDVEMPDMTGWQVCITLKQHDETKSIPVIFLTAATDSEEKIRGLDLGAMDYITKPFESSELKARVRSAVKVKELFDMLASQAMIDGLTGLHNRSYLDERLIAEVANVKRYREPLSCIMCDTDHFKRFNDQFGHAFGDTVLRHVGRVFREVARTSDVVCRYGGEEFAMLLPRTSVLNAVKCAERLRWSLASTSIQHDKDVLTVTASFGVSDVEVAGEDDLIKRADQALYHSKEAGRNRTTFATQEGFEEYKADSSAIAA
ncbi:MAG TPA: diguanylate cyclase [Tepidisphaeraceae bacterium]|nr:diguanylate cyclase [Tepidisphaeraceae bacterium]